MAILRLRDENGEVHGVRALRGDKGEAGAGVHVGSYVGICPVDGAYSQYVDLGSPHVTGVLLQTSESLLLVTADGVTADGEEVARLIEGHVMGRGDNVFLSVHRPLTNLVDMTYHYVAFIKEEAE